MSLDAAYGDAAGILDHGAITAAAQSLLDAEISRKPRSPLTDEHPGMAVADAYAIQQAYVALRVAGGADVVGHKIGATSTAIQTLFGIATPDYGVILDDMVIGGDRTVVVDELIQPMAEPELAFELGDELRGPGVTVADVMAAARGVRACIEVIDSRIEEWRIRLADTIADNGSSARCVFGGELVPLDGLDLPAVEAILHKNGDIVDRATGAAVLGNPAASVAWLANALALFGGSLPGGAVVLSGSFTTAARAAPGDEFEAEFPAVGSVACRFVQRDEEGR